MRRAIADVEAQKIRENAETRLEAAKDKCQALLTECASEVE